MAEILNFKGDYEGLSTEKAEEKLAMYGENSFSDHEDKSFSAVHILLNPAVIILFITGLFELIFLQNIAAGFACVIIAITAAVLLAVYCNKCNESISKLISAAKMKYRVVRDGKLTLVTQAKLVPDDIIVLQSGEMVPADAHILELFGLTVDESRFTGDKKPVDKFVGADTRSKELKASCIYAGSRILSGSVIARVTATGEDAYRCITDKINRTPDPNYSHYEKYFAKARTIFSLIGAVLAVASVLIASLIDNEAFTFSSAVRTAAFLLCFIPPYAQLFIRLYHIDTANICEEKGAAIKNLGVLQKLSGMTSLIIDKSVVAAPGKMEVAGIYSSSNSLMTTVTVLASNPVNTTLSEQAFMLSAQLAGTDISALRANQLIRSFEYDSDERIGGNIYKIDDKYLFCVKGDVEKVLSLCDISADKITYAQDKAVKLSRKGYEVWASAYAIFDNEENLPNTVYSTEFSFMGLVSYIGATRDTIPLAVQSCKKAGVRLVLTTSDNSATAAAMGKKIGLSADKMISGDDIRKAAENGETPDYTSAEIFCGISEEQKLAIVKGIKSQGGTVAAFGHSDSDYELLRSSDLGITSLAKTTGCIYEASGLVIREDNFSVVVDIIKEARQLHRNIKKALSLCLVSFVIMLLTAVVDIIFATGVFTPAFSALLTLFVIPLCSMCYIGCSADLKTDMKTSEFAGHGKISGRFFKDCLLTGGITGFICALFSYIVSGILTVPQTSAATFILICVSVCALALSNTSCRITLAKLIKHKAVSKKAITTIFLTALTAVMLTFIPFINSALGFEAVHPIALIAAVIIGFAPAAIKEILKKI